MPAISIKIVVQGSSGTGRTCLLMRYTTNTFPTDYVPTVFDNYSAQVSIKDSKGKDTAVYIGLWDFMHREDSARLRPLSYPGTHVILLCYQSVLYMKQYNGLEQIEKTWYPEVSKWAKDVPIILVRTKCDLEETKDIKTMTEEEQKNYWNKFYENPSFKYDSSTVISWEEGEALAKKLGFAAHVRCSALTGEGVKDAFDEAIKCGLEFYQKHPEGSPPLKMDGSDMMPGEYPQVSEPGQKRKHKPDGRCALM